MTRLYIRVTVDLAPYILQSKTLNVVIQKIKFKRRYSRHYITHLAPRMMFMSFVCCVNSRI